MIDDVDRDDEFKFYNEGGDEKDAATMRKQKKSEEADTALADIN